MFTSLLLHLVLVAPAHAGGVDPCLGLPPGPGLALCQNKAEIEALKGLVAELKTQCEAGCDATPSAPTPAPKKPSGPSRTTLKLQELEARIAELERNGATDAELEALQAEVATLRSDLTALTGRVEELEGRPAYVPPPPPPAVEPIPGRDGKDGRDGVDGQPAETTLLLAADGFYSTGVNIVGSKVEFRVGGRPTSAIHLGGYGSGFIAPGDDSFGNDLGFAAGGYLGVDATRWLRPIVTIGWREVGLDISSDGSRRSFQGLEGTIGAEVNPTGRWVIDAQIGGFFPESAALTWNVGTGLVF